MSRGALLAAASYLEASAVVKLVLAEARPQRCVRGLSDRTAPPGARDLARTELPRPVRRAAPDQVGPSAGGA